MARTNRTKRLVLGIAGALALPLVAIAAANSATAQSGGAGNDPAPPPLERQIDTTAFDDGNRAIMIRIDHTPDPQEPHSVRLVKSRAYVRRGDEGPILVETFAGDGQPLDSWKAPRPGEGGEALKDHEGRYGIPYSKALRRVRITDRDTNRSVDVKLDQAIEGFCTVNPGDVACDQVDLTAHVGLASYDPIKLAVGESVDVPVTVTFANLQGETGTVGGYISPIYVGAIVSFETADKTTPQWDAVDGAFNEPLVVTYTMTCREAGTDRVFPAASFHALGGPHVVEANTADNAWNTYFDVICV